MNEDNNIHIFKKRKLHICCNFVIIVYIFMSDMQYSNKMLGADLLELLKILKALRPFYSVHTVRTRITSC